MTERPILIGAVAMAPARLKVRDSGQVMVETCDELEDAVRACLVSAPFKTISIILRYVAESTRGIEVGKINRHKELEVGIEIKVSNIKSVDRDTLKDIFKECALHTLHLVSEQFDLGCNLPGTSGMPVN